MSDTVLQIEGLTTRYATQDGVVKAVEGFSLDVEPGEMVGLVGESGCGKSTVAFSIMRLLPKAGEIVGGHIYVNGADLATLDESRVRALRGRQVAMVFQDALAALDPTMRVGRQLMEPMQTNLSISAGEARRRAIDLLEKVGIPSPEKRLAAYPHQFSCGMRQRVMIAMALSCEPRVLLADEPTTGLDVTLQRQILDLILDLRANTGAGVILITHDVGAVAAACDRVVVMYAGRKVESGPTEKVFLSPKHPYTVGLLRSTLGLRRGERKTLKAIPGLPPDLIDLPDGCLFWPRCEQRVARCLQENPVFEEANERHVVACWNWR